MASDDRIPESKQCEHRQCCICLKRECNRPGKRFMDYGSYIVCSDSCVIAAISVAYYAACRLGGAIEEDCGKKRGNNG